METLQKERKLAAINRDNHEDHPRNNQAWNTSYPRIQEGNITQVSEEIERESRVTKKLSHEFSRTKNHILGALSVLDEFVLKSQVRVRSGPVPEASQNSKRESQEA